MESYQALEQEWADWNGLDPRGMVACNSGTASLHLGLEALQLPKGSQVIVPDYTMVACPRAVVMAGLTPIFVDCRDNLLMDLGLAARAVTELAPVYATMTVHIYGRQCDINSRDDDGPNAPGTVYNIEDLAEAHGVRPHPGTDVACWSFFKNKTIAGEEGGAVWFRDSRNADLARQLRSLGFTDAHDFEHIPRGHNYRLANCLADRIRYNFGRADFWLQCRRNIEEMYEEACPKEWRMPQRDIPWVYDLRIPSMTREKQKEVVKTLNLEGIQARMGFWPLHLQEEFLECRTVGKGNASRIAPEIVYLPINPGQTTLEAIRKSFAILRGVLG